MGCCGSKEAIQVKESGEEEPETKELAFSKMHKAVDAALPNTTLEALTVFPGYFTTAEAAAVLCVPEERAKELLGAVRATKLVQPLAEEGVRDSLTLAPMVRSYVLKVAGERLEANRDKVLEAYLRLMVPQMQEADKLLEVGDKQAAEAILSKRRTDFAEVLQLVSKQCGSNPGLLDIIGAPDSMQNSNVYSALGLWNQACMMWGALYHVLRAQLPAGLAAERHRRDVVQEYSGQTTPDALTPLTPTSGNALHSLATCAYHHGEAHRAMHRITEAEECYKEALTLWEGLLPDEDSRLMCCLSLIAACLKARKDMPAAELYYERLFAACQSVLPPNDPEFLYTVKELAECLEAQQKLKEAQPLKALTFRASAGSEAVAVC